MTNSHITKASLPNSKRPISRAINMSHKVDFRRWLIKRSNARFLRVMIKSRCGVQKWKEKREERMK